MAYRQNDSQIRNDRVRFDLMEHIGVLSMKDNGWTREVNIVSWNGGAAKVDIREWDPEHKRMTKGVTLFEDEAETLTKVLARRYGLRLNDREPANRIFFKEENGRDFYTNKPSPDDSADEFAGKESNAFAAETSSEPAEEDANVEMNSTAGAAPPMFEPAVVYVAEKSS